MASQEQIDATYNYMDAVWRQSVGPHADITAALFDGHAERTLEEAQAAKHEFILNALDVGPGTRLLDIGCGWGGLMNAARRRGATVTGLTLSSKQRDACVLAGFDARLVDWNDADSATLGEFDAVASVGAFEHFCSPEQCRAGHQLPIYQKFFATCRRLLRPRGRLFVQTMIWGPWAPALESVSLNAPRESAEYMVAALVRFYPGSWLPESLDQIAEAARPHFAIDSHRSGREDYIRTMREWRSRTFKPGWRALPALARLLPAFVRDPEFRLRVEVLMRDYNMRCLERRIMEHERIVFAQTPR